MAFRYIPAHCGPDACYTKDKSEMVRITAAEHLGTSSGLGVNRSVPCGLPAGGRRGDKTALAYQQASGARWRCDAICVEAL